MWNDLARAPYGGVYPCRLITVVGTRARFRTFWYTGLIQAVNACTEHPEGHAELGQYVDRCPNSYGRGAVGDTHNAYRMLEDTPGLDSWRRWDEVKYGGPGDNRWPSVCDDCGAPVPEVTPPPFVVGARAVDVTRTIGVDRLYSTPSGELEVGCLVYLGCPGGTGSCPYWDNCTGRHLHAVLPNGSLWDIDSRASNCTLKADRTHRCWTQEGDPAVHLTVGKRGPTCAAGAGSIQHGDYHGFLDGHVISPNRGQGRRP